MAVVEQNLAAWGRVEVGRQRVNGAREWALKRARLLSGITAALLRINAQHQRQKRPACSSRGRRRAGEVGSAGQWEKEWGRGPPVSLFAGLILRANRFLSGREYWAVSRPAGLLGWVVLFFIFFLR